VDAIVLAGGAGSRLGGADKPDQLVGTASLLQRVVAAVRGARTIVVVGPERAGIPGVTWCREQPPGGGPVAAIAAGLPQTTSGEVLVLAADLPWVAGAIDPLLAALADADCAVLVDAAGRRNPLASAWRRGALEGALDRVGSHAGARAFALLDGLPVAEVVDAGGWAEDCDTPNDLARAREREHRLHGSSR
jgi:molybdopterin-guanine dinucleotide biosynthesis protein A